MGVYHKSCDENLVEFADVKEGTKKVLNSTKELVKDGYNYVTQEDQ
jgi:hypothetical protein